MALVSAQNSVRSSTTAKQIVLSFSAVSGTLLYTVPAGRMCTAYAATATNSSYFLITVPSGIALHPVYISSTSFSWPIPFTFLPGTLIFASGQGGTLIGIETDLTI